MDIGRVGLWTFALDQMPTPQAQATLAEIEELGYGAVWIPEAVGRDPLVHAALLLSATQRITVATGIANIYSRDAMAMAAGHKTLTEAFPDRFLLGLGVSHQPMVEGFRGHTYGPPLATMRSYLDAMDAALYMAAPPTTEPRRCIGALGPKMLGLAAERTWGAHPYNVTAEHTAQAREILGADRLLAPELAVVLDTDPVTARATGREHLSIYLGLPNYVNNLLRLGFTEADVADGGSDRLIDAIVPWGDEARIAAAVAEHHDAGADHVCVQVIVPRGADAPMEQWRRLAPALLG
ncbi:MAG: LLM class F420-dependent oxidoreductase [Acidimicrobiales bacterium]|jgi:probable F420-dependent oxidoreductase|nr:LLM class F420-dependent oxidoreductase [Acidimicrobiales bacterium]